MQICSNRFIMSRSIIFPVLLTLYSIFSATAIAQTNDFYDDAPQSALNGSTLVVNGEIEQSYTVDFAALPLREVIVKEASYTETAGKFIGAYQYEGYSLYDILNKAVLAKKNANEFPPIIDLYVEIANAKGEKVVISWGEIYYPANRHQIIIASKVRRIVPSKTKELWTLPVDSKLVVAADLYTERNIDSPVSITIKSANVDYKIVKDMPYMYSPTVALKLPGSAKSIDEKSITASTTLYNTVFYGRGKGIHSTTPFNGVLLKERLKNDLSINPAALRHGILVFAGVDGYRGVFTLSEVFNRNDQAELLLVPQQGVVGSGAYQLFPAMDFFSDRAIKGLAEIRYMEIE